MNKESEKLERERKRIKILAEEWDTEQRRYIVQAMATGELSDSTESMSMQDIMDQVRREDKIIAEGSTYLQEFDQLEDMKTTKKDNNIESAPPMDHLPRGVAPPGKKPPKYIPANHSFMTHGQKIEYLKDLKESLQSPWIKRAKPPIIDREKQKKEREEAEKNPLHDVYVPEGVSFFDIDKYNADLQQMLEKQEKETRKVFDPDSHAIFSASMPEEQPKEESPKEISREEMIRRAKRRLRMKAGLNPDGPDDE